MPKDPVICIRGAGDLASGVALRLYRAGFTSLLMLERPAPLAVRRTVSFCEAVYHGLMLVEDVPCRLIKSAGQRFETWNAGEIALLIDPEGTALPEVGPYVIIDAVMAKKNLCGTAKGQAALVIALGPGFTAGVDADCVVETNRGHNLGRVLRNGTAEANTGIPGQIAGYGRERLLRAPEDGIFVSSMEIGTMVKCGDTVGRVGQAPVHASVDGVLRGLLRSNTTVEKGLKLGDVDPRGNRGFCHTASEKSLAIGGGVLEAISAAINAKAVTKSA